MIIVYVKVNASFIRKFWELRNTLLLLVTNFSVQRTRSGSLAIPSTESSKVFLNSQNPL
jgi:hypothetical protein